MKRFYNDDSDREDPKYFENNEDDDFLMEESDYFDEGDIDNIMNYELAQESLRHNLMDRAISLAKNNWLWPFKSLKTKMEDIHYCYRSLKMITEEMDD